MYGKITTHKEFEKSRRKDRIERCRPMNHDYKHYILARHTKIDHISYCLQYSDYVHFQQLCDNPFYIELNKLKIKQQIFNEVVFDNKSMKLILSIYGNTYSALIKQIGLVYKTKLSTLFYMTLDDFNKFKQFMNPTPEPQSLIHQSQSQSPNEISNPNLNELQPTNILIPQNETLLYRSGCYLIQRQSDSIYKRVKIGKGKDVLKRINGEMAYKNCVVISINHVDLNKLNDCEREIIQTFTERFKLIKEAEEGMTGNETFEIDDLFETKKLFDSICEKYFI